MTNLRVDEARLLEFAKSIELKATRVLEGLHKSKRAGGGIEFQDLRPYSDGEDSRFIDWKRWGATDRFFVKNFEKSERTAWLIITDASESMQYKQKPEWLRSFLASFIYICQALGDRWRLANADCNSFEEALPLLLNQEFGIKPEDLSKVEARADERVLLLSDLMFEPTLCSELWEQDQHSIEVIQVLSQEEAQFAFNDVIEFRDLESPHKLVLDAGMTRKLYLKTLSELQTDWDQMIRTQGHRFQFLADLGLIERQLTEFFQDL